MLLPGQLQAGEPYLIRTVKTGKQMMLGLMFIAIADRVKRFIQQQGYMQSIYIFIRVYYRPLRINKPHAQRIWPDTKVNYLFFLQKCISRHYFFLTGCIAGYYLVSHKGKRLCQALHVGINCRMHHGTPQPHEYIHPKILPSASCRKVWCRRPAWRPHTLRHPSPANAA